MMNLHRSDGALFQRPAPYQKGNLTLWSSPWIAENVLKKHLDDSVDCGSRRGTVIGQCAEWIRSLVPHARRILDVGCGPGLYAPLLCRDGTFYEGFDISPYQIDYAGRHCSVPGCTEFYVCSLQEWSSSRIYDAALLLYGIYSFVDRGTRTAFLQSLYERLSDEGVVVIEVFTPQHYRGREESTDWEYLPDGGFWSPEPYLELNAFRRYDAESLVLVQAGVLEDGFGYRVWNSWLQTFCGDTLMAEAREAGFTRFRLFGSCTGAPFQADSEVLCLCAQK